MVRKAVTFVRLINKSLGWMSLENRELHFHTPAGRKDLVGVTPVLFRRLEGFCSSCGCCTKCCADTQFVLSYPQVLLESGPFFFSAKGDET